MHGKTSGSKPKYKRERRTDHINQFLEGLDCLTKAGNYVDSKLCFRYKAPEDAYNLAKDINRISNALGYTSPRNQLTPIVRSLGHKMGDHNLEWFLNKKYGPAFVPREATMKKYRALYKELRRRYRAAYGHSWKFSSSIERKVG